MFVERKYLLSVGRSEGGALASRERVLYPLKSRARVRSVRGPGSGSADVVHGMAWPELYALRAVKNGKIRKRRKSVIFAKFSDFSKMW